MKHYITTLEKFEVKATYFVEADSQEVAILKIHKKEIPYEFYEHTDNDEFIQVLDAVTLKE